MDNIGPLPYIRYRSIPLALLTPFIASAGLISLQVSFALAVQVHDELFQYSDQRRVGRGFPPLEPEMGPQDPGGPRPPESSQRGADRLPFLQSLLQMQARVRASCGDAYCGVGNGEWGIGEAACMSL